MRNKAGGIATRELLGGIKSLIRGASIFLHLRSNRHHSPNFPIPHSRHSSFRRHDCEYPVPRMLSAIVFLVSKLIYVTNMSLDGYIEDANGSFDWGYPDQVFDFITGVMRTVRTHVLGRRLYETMTYWDAAIETYQPEQREFARVWQNAETILFSRMLTSGSPRVRVEREFDAQLIRNLKHEADGDVFIGGAEIAGFAFQARLIDECHLFVHSVVVGSGKAAFPVGIADNLHLLETRRFSTAVAYLKYAIPAEFR